MDKFIKLIIVVFLPFICWSQQPGFRKTYDASAAGASFVDIAWDGEKLITMGQFLTPNAPNGALNGLLYMELDTNGNTLLTDIYFHPNDAVTPGVENRLFASNNGIIYSMNQIFYDSLILLALYQNSERIKIYTTSIPGLQKWLNQCVDWGESILLSGQRQNYQYKTEGMLIKADKMGNEIWRKYYSSLGLDCSIGEPYIVDDNTIILAGRKAYWPGIGSIVNKWTKTWLITVDSLGEIKSEWESPKNVENGVSTRMLKTADGNWLYCTKAFIPMPGPIDDFGTRPKLVCRDSNFNLVWEKYLSIFNDKSASILDITPTSDGNYLVVGKWTGYTTPAICKFSPDGDIIWSYYDQDTFFTNGDSFLGGVVELPSGSVVAAGYSEDYTISKSYGLLIKLDKNGRMDTLGMISTYETDLASKIKVYPNPSNSIINIENPIGEKIEIYDMEGRKVRECRITSDAQVIDVSNLSTGTYHLKMSDKKLRVTYPIIKIE
jgi:Secretion system C-terminal sorting domain